MFIALTSWLLGISPLLAWFYIYYSYDQIHTCILYQLSNEWSQDVEKGWVNLWGNPVETMQTPDQLERSRWVAIVRQPPTVRPRMSRHMAVMLFRCSVATTFLSDMGKCRFFIELSFLADQHHKHSRLFINCVTFSNTVSKYWLSKCLGRSAIYSFLVFTPCFGSCLNPLRFVHCPSCLVTFTNGHKKS